MSQNDLDNPVYLDHAATTPMFAEAKDAMLAYFNQNVGNPTGAHLSAQKSRRQLDNAREKIADILKVQMGDVIFCSGGTEANNLAIFGSHQKNPNPKIFCSAIEHPAVLRPIQSLHGKTLGVLPSGVLDLNQLEQIDETTQLVSVMAVNNETGIIQPLAEVAEIVRKKAPDALLHTDAAQAVLWLDIAEHAKDFDLISLSAHKFGGPSGVGALIIKSQRPKINPQQLGGKQERDRRSGTPNVAGAIGMSVAIEIARQDRTARNKKIAKLRDSLQDGLIKALPQISPTGESQSKVAAACHLCIPDIVGEELLFLLTNAGIEASAASSCASGAEEASHVLSAMGYPPDLAQGAIRFFLGHTTQQSHIDYALEKIPAAINTLVK